MANEVAITENKQPSTPQLTINDLKNQVALIHAVMKSVMRENEHYGKIPGCGDKPTLLKSGAEKLALTFRLAPHYQIIKHQHANDHREYEVITTLTNITNNKVLGEGVGCCSTLENKYRYRWENTNKSVPKEYWDSKDNEILGGQSYSPRKLGEKGWFIFKKIEHDNPTDYYNTALKMAKKRSLVDAILTATAASDIFTQDIEDLENLPQTQSSTQLSKKIKLSPELEIKLDEYKECLATEENADQRKALKESYLKWTIDEAQIKKGEEKKQLRLFYSQVEEIYKTALK